MYTDQFCLKKTKTYIVVVQSLSHVQLFETPQTAACQSSLSFTISQSLLKSMSLSQWCCLNISSSAAPFSFCLQFFPASGSFLTSRLFASGGQSIGASATTSVHPMNIQGWFLWGLTGLIPQEIPKSLLQYHGLKASILQRLAFFLVQLSHPYMTTGKSIALTIYTWFFQ